MSLVFVAGTGTDIGKTYVTALLARQLGAVALKPVVSGCPPMDDPDFAASDTARLLRAQGLPVEPATVQACSPWRFEAALSPDMAAAAEGRSLSLNELIAWTRGAAPAGRTVLVEGAGGLMSPVTAEATGLDWIEALGCPVLLVAGVYLGAISHALTAAAALRGRGLKLDAIVVSECGPSPVGLEATVRALERFEGPVIACPYGAESLGYRSSR